MKSPQNKMITQSDRDTKALGQEVPVKNADAYDGARIPFEGQHEKKMFFFPGLHRSVEAETQEEAERIVASDSKENI